jgi:hypothetical protein
MTTGGGSGPTGGDVRQRTILGLGVCLVFAAGLFLAARTNRVADAVKGEPEVGRAERFDSDPHAPGATHPEPVRRIFATLPTLPADAPSTMTYMDLLQLRHDPDYHSVDNTLMSSYTWDIAPDYRVALCLSRVPDDRLPFEDWKVALVEAGVLARRKAGFPPDQYHLIYPIRNWAGMHTPASPK